MPDGLWLLWNEPLSWMPYGSGYEPASLNCTLNGMSFCVSSQNRSVVRVVRRGAVDVELTLEREAAEDLRPRPGRARNSRL